MILDRFLSPGLAADPDRAFRARVVAGLALTLLLAGVASALAIAATSSLADPRIPMALTPGIGQLAALWLLRRSGDHRPAAVLQLAILVAGQAAFTVVDGGIRSPGLAWVLAVPVLATMTVGARAGWATAALAGLEIAGVAAAEQTGLLPGLSPTESAFPLLLATSLVVLLAVITAAATLFETSRIGALERTREALERLRMTHGELVQSHELTLEATRARRDFLARVSHEIRTPVQGLLGTSQLLLDRQQSDPGRELAASARDSARSLLGLMNDLLDVGRLEAGQLRLDRRSFDPRTPLEEAATMLAPAARERGLTMLCYVGPDVPTSLEGDPDRLRQVTVNLLSNAIRYSDRGDVVLRTSRVDGPALRVEVMDAGVGIDLGATPRSTLLRPFEQLEPFSTRSHGGAGLGLSIAAQLVGLMGGTLDVESEPDVGSTFWFTIPIDGPSTAPPPPPFAGQRAVVLGSHPRARSLVATMLRDWGLNARALPADDATFEELRSGGLDVDVLVLDVHQGDDERWQPAALGALPPLDGVPLIAITPASALGSAPRDPGAVVRAPACQRRLLGALHGLLNQDADSASRMAAAHATGETRLAAIPRGEGRVLIVEDDPVNALIGRRFLERLGYEVVVATDGPTGLAMAEAEAYAAVLMDCQLPGLSGYEVTERLRAGDGPNRDAPILAVTAHAQEGERERCLASGMNGCLVKPYEPEDLGRELHQLLQGRT